MKLFVSIALLSVTLLFVFSKTAVSMLELPKSQNALLPDANVTAKTQAATMTPKAIPSATKKTKPEASKSFHQAENQAFNNRHARSAYNEDMPAKPLWEFTSSSQVNNDGIPFYSLKALPASISSLALKQRFTIALPEIQVQAEAILEHHYQASDNVQVYEGPIVNLGSSDYLVIAQGNIETHVIVSTEKGTFSARIDNKTGQTHLVNESQANPELGGDHDFINAPIDPESTLSPLPPISMLNTEAALKNIH